MSKQGHRTYRKKNGDVQEIRTIRGGGGRVTYDRSKYDPHQGKRERARRVRQREPWEVLS